MIRVSIIIIFKISPNNCYQRHSFDNIPAEICLTETLQWEQQYSHYQHLHYMFWPYSVTIRPYTYLLLPQIHDNWARVKHELRSDLYCMWLGHCVAMIQYCMCIIPATVDLYFQYSNIQSTEVFWGVNLWCCPYLRLYVKWWDGWWIKWSNHSPGRTEENHHD
jgi:hypothetical protein